MNLRMLTTLALVLLTAAPSLGAARVGPHAWSTVSGAVLPPTLTSPAEGETLTDFSPTLQWQNPPGTTQVHLQVIPINNDGPGADLYLGSAVTSFDVPAPPAWYGLLPGMTYTWRVRVSDAPNAVALNDPSWSAPAERRFRTPAVSSSTISLNAPGTVTTRTPTLPWTNSRSDVFYYEVQVSKDPTFNTDPATATAMVYWELRHGGVTNPPNSYAVPSGFPLEDNTTYHWRVRPRVQGDGTPVDWSAAESFQVVVGTGGPPALSGERLTFVSRRNGPTDIFIVRPDGTGLFNLSKNSSSDEKQSWSKDGSKLVFVADRDGNREIYTMNADGSNQTRVTNNTVLDDDPTWSPDGTKIAFISQRSIGVRQHIYVMNADGSNTVRLSNAETSHWLPKWSPNGLRVMYGSQRSTGNTDIFTSNLAGTEEFNITADNPSHDIEHEWSPDGSKIVFVSFRGGSFDLYSMNADGTNPVRLSEFGTATPVWSPDGSKIAFVHDLNGNQEVLVINASGGVATNVSAHAAEDNDPDWSPDSKKLAFVSRRNGNQDIYVVNADGSGLTRVTDSPDADFNPAWAPR